MLKKSMLTALVAGKAAALTALLAGSALAQTATTTVETPGAPTAVVPEAATTAAAPVGTIVATDFPVFNADQMANDQTIAEKLLAQGFSDVKILREGSLMTVTAMREGKEIKLVYNLVEGRLIEVNGERILSEEEKAAAARETPGTGEAAAAPETPETPETTEGTDDGTEGGAAEGTDGGETEGDTGGEAGGETTGG